jgi:hypothetical protein
MKTPVVTPSYLGGLAFWSRNRLVIPMPACLCHLLEGSLDDGLAANSVRSFSLKRAGVLTGQFRRVPGSQAKEYSLKCDRQAEPRRNTQLEEDGRISLHGLRLSVCLPTVVQWSFDEGRTLALKVGRPQCPPFPSVPFPTGWGAHR